MSINAIFDSMTEEERDRARKRLSEEPTPFMGMYVSYWFPDKMNLSSFEIRGLVPRKGEILSIRSDTIHPEPDYDFRNHHWFRVKQVIYAVDVQATPKDRILYPHRMRAEVHLVRHINWFVIKMFLLTPYYNVRYHFRRWRQRRSQHS